MNLILEYPVEKLLTTLKKNREKHIKDYEKAVETYKKAVVKTLEKMLTAAQKGNDIPLHIALTKPVHYTKEYDMAIKKLEMTTKTLIELDDRTFNQLVMDDWNWRQTFIANTGYYSSNSVDYITGVALQGIDTSEDRSESQYTVFSNT